MFEGERPRLTGIAYRMLGSMSDADDVVQDAWLRWSAVDHTTINNGAAFLTVGVGAREVALGSAVALSAAIMSSLFPRSNSNSTLMNTARRTGKRS